MQGDTQIPNAKVSKNGDILVVIFTLTENKPQN